MYVLKHLMRNNVEYVSTMNISVEELAYEQKKVKTEINNGNQRVICYVKAICKDQYGTIDEALTTQYNDLSAPEGRAF